MKQLTQQELDTRIKSFMSKKMEQYPELNRQRTTFWQKRTQHRETIEMLQKMWPAKFQSQF